MKIHADYEGGNIKVIKTEGDTIFLENELRTNVIDWFYFSFCVEGAQGKTLTFDFSGARRLGYWGPAISYDYKKWWWQDEPGKSTFSSFTYTFGPDEDKVYFSQGIQYMPERFDALAEEIGLKKEPFSLSEKKRQMYSFTLGTGKYEVILTSRHHACEATGTYIIEGAMRELAENDKAFLEECKIFAVPFIDHDGVVDGDQGKGRSLDGIEIHDHNRDYTEDAHYDANRKIMEHMKANKEYIKGCLDCHSPWISGGVNDTAFIVQRSDIEERNTKFHKCFVEESKGLPLSCREEDVFPPNTEWNKDGGPKFTTIAVKLVPDVLFSFTLETCYYGFEGNKVTQESLILLGRAFGRSIARVVRDSMK